MSTIFKTLMAKATTDADGVTTVIASTPGSDRMGDVVKADWRVERYAQNSIVAWAHDYSIPPIGRAIGLEMDGDNLIARIKWDDSDHNPLGATIAHQFREGFLSAVSVGFSPGKSTPRKSLAKDDPDYAESGYQFTANELLEISAVPIGANAECLAIRAKSWGIAADTVERDLVSVTETDEDWTLVFTKPEPVEAEEPEQDTDEEPEEEPVEAGGDDLAQAVRAAMLELLGSDPAVQAAFEPTTTTDTEPCGLSDLFNL